jgi:hypothetical protein
MVPTTSSRVPGTVSFSDPIASGLPRVAVRGRPFLSGHTGNNRFRYNKGGLALAQSVIQAVELADYGFG